MFKYNIKSEMNLMQNKGLLVNDDNGLLFPISNVTLLYHDVKKTRPILNIKKVDGSYYGRVKNKIDYVKLTKNNFSTKIYENNTPLGKWCDIERSKVA